MGFDGGFNGWMFGQVLGLLSLCISVFPALWLISVPKGQRLKSKATWMLSVLTVFTVTMATVYVISSAPFYEANSRLNESFDLVEEATGLETTDENDYPRIVSVLGDRARIWPPNCIRGRLSGAGNTLLDGPLTLELREALAVSLENDGFSVSRNVFEADLWSLLAVNGDESYFFSPHSDGAAGIVSRVDSLCEDTFEAEFADSTNRVNSFLD